MIYSDDILQSNADLPLLPTTEFNHISEHIASLEKLKAYKNYTFLLGHGNPMTGESILLEAIENRLMYLRAVFRNPSRISYEEATRGCRCDFLHKEWHEFLYE